MRICFISNLYPPQIMGGAELYVEKLAKKLVSSPAGENQVVVITANQKFSLQPKVEEKDNLKIYQIWPPNLYSLTTQKKYFFILKALWHLFDLWNPFVYFAVRKILKKEKPDFVHTHNFAGLSLSIFSAIKSLGIKTIHTCHDYYLLCPYANLVCPLTNWKFRKTPPLLCKWYRKTTRTILKNKIDVVLTPSKFVMEAHLKNLSSKASAKEDGFFAASQQIILPLGINNFIHNSSFIIHDSFNILCVSQLAPHKGVSVLLHAIHNSKFLIHNSKIIMVGDGTERKNLEKLAGDNKNIVFLGQLSHQETQQKYQEADIIIIPSLAPETFSLVMFEAMSFGKLVIASKIGAIKEYLKDNETGFLFEAGNVNQLKEILEKVINNPNLIKKIGQNAQKFSQEFTFQKHREKLEKIYKKIVI